MSHRGRYKLNRRGIKDLNHYDRQNHRRRAMILAKTNGRCAYCGEEISFTEMSATEDHMRPYSVEKSDDVSNIVAACKPCNFEKKNMTVEEYRAFKAEQTGETIIFYMETLVGKGNCFMCDAAIKEDNSCQCIPSR